MRKPRFEIVRTDAGFHARFVAGNGKVVWWTENYTRRRKAHEAVQLIADLSVIFLDVRDVDQRTGRAHAHP